MKVSLLVVFLLVAVATSAPTEREIPQVSEPQYADISHGSILKQTERRRRAAADDDDPFGTETMAPKTIELGKFPDEDGDVKGVKPAGSGILGIIIGFIKQLIESITGNKL